MDALETLRLVWLEALGVLVGLYGLAQALEMGSVLFIGVSAALVGISLAYARHEFDVATA